MAEKQVESISLKAMVDKVNNRVLFAEANEDFVDILLSFLTMPMGTIVRLTRSKPPTLGIGCMNKLYESIENFDAQQLWTNKCKSMLLYPRNAAAAECKRLKLKVDDGRPLSYFICRSQSCTLYNYKLLSHYRGTICRCGEMMDQQIPLYGKNGGEEKTHDARYNGVFVKGLTRLIISDELEIMPATVEASLPLMSKLGVTVIDGTTTEECNFNIGVNEVLALLKCSFLSKTPLTETLLKHNPESEVGKERLAKKQKLIKEEFDQGSYIDSRKEEPPSDVCGKIGVKLIVSKSKNTVCFAEASEDFIDLLFSFLTVPLGCVAKEMSGATLKGCVTHLYNSIEKLDAKQYLNSSKHKEMLLSPKLAPNFRYENDPLGIEEDKHPSYYCSTQNHPWMLACDKTLIHDAYANTTLTVADPKSPLKKATGGGFVAGPAKFTVTDNLIITSISPISYLHLLNKLKVPFSDVEERDVYVGTKEALRLMVTSLVSESVLTDAFLRKLEPEY